MLYTSTYYLEHAFERSSVPTINNIIPSKRSNPLNPLPVPGVQSVTTQSRCKKLMDYGIFPQLSMDLKCRAIIAMLEARLVSIGTFELLDKAWITLVSPPMLTNRRSRLKASRFRIRNSTRESQFGISRTTRPICPLQKVNKTPINGGRRRNTTVLAYLMDDQIKFRRRRSALLPLALVDCSSHGSR